MKFLLLVAITFFSFAAFADQTSELDALANLANGNEAVLAALEKSNLNCCDPRYEIACNDILKLRSEKGFASTRIHFDDDKSDLHFIPLHADRKDDSNYLISGLVWRKGFPIEEFQQIFKTVGGKLVLQYLSVDQKKFKDWAVSSNSESIMEVTSVRPNQETGSRACYLQRYLPPTKKLAKRVTDLSCSYKYPIGAVPADVEFPPMNSKFENKELCFYTVQCRNIDDVSGGVSETTVGCLPVESRCPNADRCYIDTAVKFKQGSMTEFAFVGDPVAPEKLDLTPLQKTQTGTH